MPIIAPLSPAHQLRAGFLALALPFLCSGWAMAEPIDPGAYDHPVRVACLGDSITEGVGVADRARESYPAQLQAILGPKWAVTNFGVGGRTLLRKADPFAIGAALRARPDVVVIMLGTNDSRQQTWDKFGGDFIGDYSAIVEQFKALDSHPKIWICRPVPAFPANYGITEELLTSKTIPAIDEVAKAEAVPLIDLHAALLGQKANFPDKIHPNAQAARQIAAAVARELAGALPEPKP